MVWSGLCPQTHTHAGCSSRCSDAARRISFSSLLCRRNHRILPPLYCNGVSDRLTGLIEERVGRTEWGRLWERSSPGGGGGDHVVDGLMHNMDRIRCEFRPQFSRTYYGCPWPTHELTIRKTKRCGRASSWIGRRCSSVVVVHWQEEEWEEQQQHLHDSSRQHNF